MGGLLSAAAYCCADNKVDKLQLDEIPLVELKSEQQRLGFAVLLKFFQIEGDLSER